MANWSGFTDDDIRKMRQSSQSDDSRPAVNSNKKVVANMQQQKKRNMVRQSLSDINSESFAARQKTADTINQSMKLSAQEGPRGEQSTPVAPRTNSHQETRTDKETKQPEAGHTKSPGSERIGKEQPDILKTAEGSNGENGQQTQPGCSEIKELDEHQAMSVELGNVQKFQQRQKVIEEANKHKRALLAKAIIDRQKKAKAEAAKLMTVQQELNHLDTLLTADVNIIRDRIEVASLEYMDAQYDRMTHCLNKLESYGLHINGTLAFSNYAFDLKSKRYEKSEKEFIAAKMDLFSKGEVKEQLTEHLYTIIHQNEVRKAKKLVELMEKLAMEVTPEEIELTIQAIPQLTNFTAVSTIHDPFHIRNIATADKEKVKAAGVEISSSEVSEKPEAKYPLPNCLTPNVESSIQTMTASTDVVVHSEKDIPGFKSPNMGIDSSIHIQQNEILQSNQNNKDTDLNHNLETLTKPETASRSDSVDVSHSNCQSLVPNDAEPEANITRSSDLIDLLQDRGDSAYQTQGTIPLGTDKPLSQSDSEALQERSAPAGKDTATPGPSLRVSSGNGWTLPFS